MTPALFQQVGEALYGPRWQAAMARDLGVQLRSVQRWLSGDREIPDIRAELADLLGQRRDDLVALIAELSNE